MQAITAPLNPMFNQNPLMTSPFGQFQQMNEPQLFMSQATSIIANLNYLRFNLQNVMGGMVAAQWLNKFVLSLEEFFPLQQFQVLQQALKTNNTIQVSTAIFSR